MTFRGACGSSTVSTKRWPNEPVPPVTSTILPSSPHVRHEFPRRRAAARLATEQPVGSDRPGQEGPGTVEQRLAVRQRTSRPPPASPGARSRDRRRRSLAKREAGRLEEKRHCPEGAAQIGHRRPDPDDDVETSDEGGRRLEVVAEIDVVDELDPSLAEPGELLTLGRRRVVLETHDQIVGREQRGRLR